MGFVKFSVDSDTGLLETGENVGLKEVKSR